MALVLADRVQETTTSTGTGSVTLLGAVTGYQTFAVIGNGNTCYYTIADQGGSNWEVGIGTYSTTGPTLARTTVLSNSNGNTSPVNFPAGIKTVFVTYPSEKSVNLDSAGNVSPLGTIASGTWQGSTVGVAYGGTGVTTSSGPNSVVLRDSNNNITSNNIDLGFQGIATTGGTTTFTAATPYFTQFTGSSNQTLVLPDATTLEIGSTFVVDNDSTGTITVKDGAGTTFETIITGSIHNFILQSNATIAGTWLRYGSIPSDADWGTNSLQLGSTVITGGTWQGGTIQSGYGGTGLTTFSAANYALYSTSASALTAGTLPVPAGGTGQTTFASGYIPYGNTTAALQSSASLQFNGTYLIVGGTTPLGGATNPITAFSSTANNYVQTYIYNASTGTSASADFVAYADNSADTHGWADMGYTSSTYTDAVYTVTGPNEAYLFGSAPSASGATGNLVYATDNTGTVNAHQWYVGGFTQAKSAYKMQLDANKLELKTPIYVTGSTGTSGQVLTSAGSGAAPTWTTPIAGGGTVTTTDFTATAGQTVFTVNYTVGSTEVYQNGVKLGIADFTATNGTSITLATGATAGDLIEVVTFSVLNLYSAITYEDFSGTGSQTIYTMSAVPANSASLLVAISGVVQDPGTYTVSSNTLTFLTAPPSGSSNISVRYLGVASIGTVSSFSAGTTGLTPNTGTTGAVVLGGTLATTNGGTGLTSFTSGGAVYATSTSALTTGTLPASAGGTGLSSPGTSGNVLTSNGTGWVASPVPSQFATGTAMLFQQTAAPTGWTKSLTHDNKALRVVSGTASSGGTVAFTTAFASQAVSGTVGISGSTTATGTVGSTTLSESQMPSHRHQGVAYCGAAGCGPLQYRSSTTNILDTLNQYLDNTSFTGGSGSHNHSFTGDSHTHTGGTFSGTAINLAVQYVDLIIATKD